jgi:hypothetical protein
MPENISEGTQILPGIESALYEKEGLFGWK